ncbi:N-acetyl-gamma-glutamyl-phosphate reductase [Candidatus Pandoraea novymonadis]|uniref:N-acetyl-gamma-glutamyl-phosphate reductase n=1 Tax=Candidatus Pandoraea novymonadis TaxID=1808959 RepID=A0ABX5FF41_9BURK|nr:N-acetyl-gamma-glutamyl-phosphate reductase [Candidatus Pandoraea novymonadis]PSB92319.1 N-acetyl-gamma-glutamyl-phosphate reductase [Candidatus Pandoraea novymonadis]
MIKVGLVGGTGYTGVELLRLLAQHPQVHLHAITSRKEAGLAVADLYPNLRGHVDLIFAMPDDASLTDCDVVFFATPHGVAMRQTPGLLAAGVRVIDLAADFRLKDAAVFEQWYGIPHSCPKLLDEAVYGLPEINREQIRNARVIGLPGCYPTSIQLGFAPLLAGGRKLVDPRHLIADAKSGASGAGRKAETSLILTENYDNFKAYGVKGHRHHPEIKQGLEAIANSEIGLTFVPHLLPTIRGIHSTLYASILPDAQGTNFQQLFEQYFSNEPFVDVLPAGSMPETRWVRASNYVRVSVHRPNDGDMLIILVVEDNLVKGASGQGVQCMNLMFGLPEEMGLTHIPVMP